VLAALASIGSYEVAIAHATDDGGWQHYVASVPVSASLPRAGQGH
jgi:hypothetical protein